MMAVRSLTTVINGTKSFAVADHHIGAYCDTRRQIEKQHNPKFRFFIWPGRRDELVSTSVEV